jgi:hypothetical protein
VVKNSEDWVTGDEPITVPQESYLRTPARAAGEEAPEHPSKAQASALIDKLQARSERIQRR